jgi:hypothetical protein
MSILKRTLVQALPSAILVAALASIAVFSARAQGAPETRLPAPPPVVELAPLPVPEVPAPVVAEIDPRLAALTHYTLTVMESWQHAKGVDAVDYPTLAGDIAAVALAAKAPAVPGDGDRHRTAVLLAALAYYEGARFAAYVDDGRCDDWMHEAWKHGIEVQTGGVSVFSHKPLTRLVPDRRVLPAEAQKILAFGDCDGGAATSLWQIHSMTVTDDLTGEKEQMTEDKLRDRRYAISMALMLARRAMHSDNLSGYTGENCAIDGCSKANARLDFAKAAWKKHPYDPLPKE